MNEEQAYEAYEEMMLEAEIKHLATGMSQLRREWGVKQDAETPVDRVDPAVG